MSVSIQEPWRFSTSYRERARSNVSTTARSSIVAPRTSGSRSSAPHSSSPRSETPWCTRRPSATALADGPTTTSLICSTVPTTAATASCRACIARRTTCCSSTTTTSRAPSTTPALRVRPAGSSRATTATVWRSKASPVSRARFFRSSLSDHRPSSSCAPRAHTSLRCSMPRLTTTWSSPSRSRQTLLRRASSTALRHSTADSKQLTSWRGTDGQWGCASTRCCWWTTSSLSTVSCSRRRSRSSRMTRYIP